jgi:signal transduction histidine kinase
VETTNIEKFFLNILLRVSILGVFLVLVSDVLLFPQDKLSILVAATILSACLLSYLIRKRYPTSAVLIVTSIALMAMVYQRWFAPYTTTSLSVVLLAGFIFSIMLKGKTMWVMHGIAFLVLNTVFALRVEGSLTAAITYSTLYFILTYATWLLKYNYDKMNLHLRNANVELHEKSNEIAAQNEELLQIQDHLNLLNSNLEKEVAERTVKIKEQNEILIKYSHTNAHHLRGPVARLLGLASVCQKESNPDYPFFISKMLDQTRELDGVIKQINVELESMQLKR